MQNEKGDMTWGRRVGDQRTGYGLRVILTTGKRKGEKRQKLDKLKNKEKGGMVENKE